MRVESVQKPRKSREAEAAPAGRPAAAAPVPAGSAFRAELDLAELDDRRRPGGPWVGRGHELSRSHLTFRSRKMCYQGRLLVVLVHLVDDRPAFLFGQVRGCEYDSDGQYRTCLELLPVPLEPDIQTWIKDRDARGVVPAGPGS